MELLEEWRNTIGDLNEPSFAVWTKLGEQEGLKNISECMILYIWVLWLVNLTFMLIILLNLLISVMTQAYEAALDDNFTMKYQFRVSMACEAASIIESLMVFTGGFQKMKMFVLQYNILDEEGDASTTTKEIKAYLLKDHTKVKE